LDGKGADSVTTNTYEYQSAEDVLDEVDVAIGGARFLFRSSAIDPLP
jgi:hypothetical protein